MRSGSMTTQEVDIMVRLFNEGKTVEEIAERLKRSTRGINISLNKHKAKLKSPEEIMEIIRNKNKESKTNQVTTSSINPTKKYDKSGMLALANGGWSPRRIAEEHNCTVEEVTEILAEMRKK